MGTTSDSPAQSGTTPDATAPGGSGPVAVAVEMPAGVRVGHWTGDGTGVTVILPPPGTVGSGEVRGGAPATREFALLAPERMVDRVDAVVLSGGSAFGLAAGDGVMRALRDRGEGFPTAHGAVPIVVGMSIFDASVATTPPDATAGHAALLDALSSTPAPNRPASGAGPAAADAGSIATDTAAIPADSPSLGAGSATAEAGSIVTDAVPFPAGPAAGDAVVANGGAGLADAGGAGPAAACGTPGGAIQVGRVGAGTGAASGRWLGRQDPGGFGAASARDGSGAIVTAFAVVNALGVIVAPDGSPLLTEPDHGTPPSGDPLRPAGPPTGGNAGRPAGPSPARDMRQPSGSAPAGDALRPGSPSSVGDAQRPTGPPSAGLAQPPGGQSSADGAQRPFGSWSGRENTTLVVVVTDAKLTKSECLLVAQSGHDGMARALHPSHTRFDGDAVVALATGSTARVGDNDLDTIRATTIDVVAAAIRNAVAHPHP